jgi:hypothetical protein
VSENKRSSTYILTCSETEICVENEWELSVNETVMMKTAKKKNRILFKIFVRKK